MGSTEVGYGKPHMWGPRPDFNHFIPEQNFTSKESRAAEGAPARCVLGTRASPPGQVDPVGAVAAPRADRRRRLTRWWRSSSSPSWSWRTPRPSASPGPGTRRSG